MGAKLSVEDLDLKGKRVLVRVDFNVPFDKKGAISDDSRIRLSCPTIQYILDQGGSVILLSHLGRPKETFSSEFSLAPCARRLAEMLNRPVEMASDCIGLEVEARAKQLQPGQILMLENLRFHKGEEHPSQQPEFADSLAVLGDAYVNDAFGAAHRAHASVVSLPSFFPRQAAAGFLMEKEMEYLGSTLSNPKRPFCAILGGSKISSKFKVIQALKQQADVLLIGGAMAYTFFAAEGIPIGNSLFEKDFISIAREILEVDTQSRCRVLLPIDLVITKTIEPDAPFKIIDVKEGIPEGYEGVDIGPKTIELYAAELKNCRTVFWNGPVGVFECPPFDKGTFTIASLLAQLPEATTIVGGGDSIAAIKASGVADSISHLSTGGGASLEYIELGQLPGIEALSPKEEIAKS